MCPQSGDGADGAYPLLYGVPGPRQVTVDPSPIRQVAETGVAVAVTLSPGTEAVFDREAHAAWVIHNQVGKPVSCKSPGAGEDRMTGLGRTQVADCKLGQHSRRWRGHCNRDSRWTGNTLRAGQRLDGDLAARRNAPELLALRATAP